jgi:hypothetical protein
MKRFKYAVVTALIIAFLAGCAVDYTPGAATYRVRWAPDYAVVLMYPNIWDRGEEPTAELPVDLDQLIYILSWLELVTFNATDPVLDMTVDLIISVDNEYYEFSFDDGWLILRTPGGEYFNAEENEHVFRDGNFWPIFNIGEMVHEIRLGHYYGSMVLIPVILREYIDIYHEMFENFEHLGRDGTVTTIDNAYNETIIGLLRELVLTPLHIPLEEEFALGFDKLRALGIDGEELFLFGYYGDFAYILSHVLEGGFDAVTGGTVEYLNELAELLDSF